MVIRIRDLECYTNASKEQKENKLVRPGRGFDLEKLDSVELRKELEEYIMHRGCVISLGSTRLELDSYNQFCRVVKDMFPDMVSVKEMEIDELENGCRKWLMKKGHKCFRIKKRPENGRNKTVVAPLITYVRNLHGYFHRDEESGGFDGDVWVIDKLDIPVDYNPAGHAKSINFKRICQPGIREEVKEVMRLHLREKTLGTVCAEMTAVTRFSKWLESEKPEIVSLAMTDRTLIEDYLFHTNTEATGRKDYSKDLYHLKGVLMTASMVLEAPVLESLFISSDFGRRPERIYRSYSDSEITRLNNAIIFHADEQTARALLVHQMLGTRISETLTIKRDAIGKSRRGKDVISIYQIKTHKTYTKALSSDIKALLDRSIEYTTERFGETEYVFVNERDPEKPMPYDRIKYVLGKIITENDLRDDHGELFRVGTHLMRHTYARKMTELHIDDMTIAKLLGQTGTSSLKFYRKMNPQTMHDETKEVLDQVGSEIEDMIGVWSGRKR